MSSVSSSPFDESVVELMNSTFHRIGEVRIIYGATIRDEIVNRLVSYHDYDRDFCNAVVDYVLSNMDNSAVYPIGSVYETDCRHYVKVNENNWLVCECENCSSYNSISGSMMTYLMPRIAGEFQYVIQFN